MIEIVSEWQASVTPNVDRDPDDGGEGQLRGVANLFGRHDSLERGPQGFYVDFDAGFVIKPHFHSVDQYQVVVRGTATLGKHALDAVTVHYADAFSPYGPIICGDDGMAFFNLRSQPEVGAHLMPGSREAMLRHAGRTMTAPTRLRLAECRRSIRVETLINPERDGLAAFEVVAGPGVRLRNEIVEGSGCYQLVLEGTVCTDRVTLPPQSCLFASAGEIVTDRVAGEDGVHLLELQLPASG